MNRSRINGGGPRGRDGEVMAGEGTVNDHRDRGNGPRTNSWETKGRRIWDWESGDSPGKYWITSPRSSRRV